MAAFRAHKDMLYNFQGILFAFGSVLFFSQVGDVTISFHYLLKEQYKLVF